MTPKSVVHFLFAIIPGKNSSGSYKATCKHCRMLNYLCKREDDVKSANPFKGNSLIHILQASVSLNNGMCIVNTFIQSIK